MTEAGRGELTGTSLRKAFGAVPVLEDVSFRARAGRVLTLLGPSGCGKTTLLRIVAGLEQPSGGELTLDGEPLLPVPAGRRDVGFVFQSYALYPHLTVERNLSLALEVRRQPRAEIAARVRETAEMLGLLPLLQRRPAQLSGGQQQRVALARALVKRPRLYLMDEPLSNLDALLRETTRSELKALFARLAATVLYVTHDQGEAMSLSDEVLVLKEGRVRQCAPPQELYERPADLFVATFVGSPRMNTWTVRRDGEGLAARRVRLTSVASPPESPGELVAGFRPEHVEVSESPLPGGLEGRVELAEPLGDRTLLTVRTGDELLRALTPTRPLPERVWLRIAPERLHLFSPVDERRVSL